jgi:nitroimidazol reductase NimA-like FMN-containing flavoprotein (pyridoxamine 5'-phosphate oxidase superfamily)
MSEKIAGYMVKRTRPFVEDSYGIPEHDNGMLAWDHVIDRMTSPRNYWLSTVSPDGRPHAMPVWGVWMDDHLHFGGGRGTRKAKNLAVNPQVSIHLEDGWDVVIIEGTVEEVLDEDTQTRLDDLYEAKYGIRHGTPVWRVMPRRVFAWTDFPNDATCWRFD